MAAWKPTRWTMFTGLGDREDKASYQKAWEQLYGDYRPVFVTFTAFCLRRMGGHGLASNEAEDVVDSFFVECLEKGWLTRADQTKGRFRTFSRKLLARYAKDWMARRTAKKRMPETGAPANVDDLGQLAVAAQSQALDDAMDEEWVRHLLGEALESLRGRNERNAIAIEQLMKDPGVTHDDLALHMNMKVARVGVQLFRARHMFAEELWGRVKHTCADADDYQRERAALRPWLANYLDPETTKSLFDGVVDGGDLEGLDDDADSESWRR